MIPAKTWVQITLGAIVTALLLFVSSLPRRSAAREDPSRVAAARSLHDALQRLRSAVSDYRFDHGEWPGSPGAAPGSAAHALADRDLSSFHDAHAEGATQPVEYRLLDAYLDGHVPVNPIDGLSTVRILGGDERWPDAADDSSGWIYRPRTGELRANCRGSVPGGSLRYFDL
jgi:hypothetical protein